MDDHRDLSRNLGGSFAARVRGVVSPELVLLSTEGEPFGFVRADGVGGSRMQVGDLSAAVVPTPDGGHEITTGDAVTLTVEPVCPKTALRLTTGNRAYEANVSPLRNTAVARSSDGEETARVSGGLAGRRYGATFDPEDPAALPIAVFLLKHLTDLRSTAFRTKT